MKVINHIKLLVIILVILFFTPELFYSVSEYSTYRYDYSRVGYVNESGPSDPQGDLKYIKLDNGVNSTPIISNNMLIIADKKGIIHGFDLKTLKPLWKFPLINDASFSDYSYNKLNSPSPIYSTPTVYKDWLFCGRNDGMLYLFYIGKFYAWAPLLSKSIDLEDAIFSSPVIYKDSLYISLSSEGLLMKIDLASLFDEVKTEDITSIDFSNNDDINQKRQHLQSNLQDIDIEPSAFYRLNSKVKSTFALNEKKNILYGTSENIVFAYDINNDYVIWKYKVKGTSISSPILYKNNLYFATSQLLHSVTKDGKLNWIAKINPIYSKNSYPTPAYHKIKKWIFWGTKAFNDSNGQKIWDYWGKGEVNRDPLLTNDIVYLAGRITPGFNTSSEQLNKGFITGVSIETKFERFYLELKSPVISSLVLVDQKLYFACEDGTVYSYANYN